ncbi:hypothetical protein J5N97_008433 [Dioscorea zingiberensis]|uniref:Uncharacterized protein n=1 Tax=Dioscorea zingiberensis TaxID=325984 RepID=A0A9D5HKW0_9LILI|nr:hypothetical protein J5N97_008433 [Dioscorea zingiberensis]
MDKRVEEKGLESKCNRFGKLMGKQVRHYVSTSDSQGRMPLDTSLEEIASNRLNNGDALTDLVDFLRDDSSLLSMQPWVYKKKVCRGDGGGIRENGDCSEKFSWDSSVVELSSPRSSVALPRGFGRSRSSLRSKLHCKHSVKPVSSTEDHPVPPFYMEDYDSCSLSSSTVQTMRPFFITDGNDSVISKSSVLNKEVRGITTGAADTLIGVPPLPVSRNSKQKRKGAYQHGSQKLPLSSGSSDAMLLFFLGISIGATSTILSKSKEVEKLSDLLKHTESLVQDLQEELEMKNSLTVKELPDEASKSLEVNENFTDVDKSIDLFHSQLSCLQSPAQKNAKSTEGNFSKSAHTSKSLSNIEAELEAELEKLELNMSATGLDEIDPDLTAEVVSGELKADIFNRRAEESLSNAHTNSSSKSSTPRHDTNHSVSPRELSLRLHKVIQSRLEERIEELERALDQSQKQVKLLESEKAMSQTSFSNSYMGSSSQASPTIMEQEHTLAAPLCLKLSGDALSAYNEAYEEFMRTTDVDEDQHQVDGLSPKWEENLRSNIYKSGGESDADDEGELLIKQIVERARKGSPVLIQAQKMLFSIDE